MVSGFRRILCPIDFDDNAMEALALAAQLARQNDATVMLLHVVPFVMPPSYAPSNVYTSDVQQESARKRMGESAQKHLKGIKCELSTHVGDVAATILRAERELAADVIVMATHGRRGASRVLLGSVAERIVRQASCPVLTMRPSASD
ncbi:MAG: universal stress protein [Deltaproteobacteria bacterium]|nr:universal stress protein [Deltaproteobacteria bacterium]MBV8453600.1 universal stress protein [Deltaproteobacteria bacterium]